MASNGTDVNQLIAKELVILKRSSSQLYKGKYVDEEEGGDAKRLKLATKMHDEYTLSNEASRFLSLLPSAAARPAPKQASGAPAAAAPASSTEIVLASKEKKPSSTSVTVFQGAGSSSPFSQAITLSSAPQKPTWHAPWKLMRVIAGHLGWVRCVDVDHSNEWFATGSADRTVKIWDLASGTLKLTLTGHISTVRGVAISPRHPYLFSVAEDKMVKCWDLEYNKVIRHYHGHLSGVYCVNVHPSIDLLLTGGRDSTVRVWDMRTRAQVHCLSGHTSTIANVKSQTTDPQVISGSHDTTLRLWDLAAGKTMATLTNHKKSIRGLVVHPTEYSFCSAGADHLKHWKLPEGQFIKNFAGHRAIVNTASLNHDNVLFSGADNGSMCFWDWKTGHCFQQLTTTPQPGSLESEAGIFASTFDQTGSRLITVEADKSIKVWCEDEEATEETHPITGWNPSKVANRF